MMKLYGSMCLTKKKDSDVDDYKPSETPGTILERNIAQGKLKHWFGRHLNIGEIIEDLATLAEREPLVARYLRARLKL